ncbi:MAG TPA: RDD family protein [Bacteroidia bacterium]|nr:RDD family protein [Bacteroidia bacterium]
MQLQQNYFGYQLASKGERFLAALLESLILYLPLAFFTGTIKDSNYSASSIIINLIFSAALGAMFYSMWSGNLGHKIMRLKVISSQDGSDKRNAADGAMREGLKYVSGLLLIPIIWILWDPDNQNLYDKATKTYVVKDFIS